jgi:ADP-heptose:LPS heptosyltransferase/Tfp pilus assembly protein PilF
MYDEKKMHDSAIERYNKKDYETAIIIFKNLVENTSSPINIVKYFHQMGVVYECMSKYLEAITECYIKIIKIDNNNGSILNQIGTCYFKLNQFKLAVHYFNKVLKIKELPDVYCNIGNCYISTKEYSLAEKNFLLAYKINNKSDLINGSLGCLYYYTKKYDKSIEYYTKIERAKDSDIYNLCFPYLAKKEFEKGFELYESRLNIKSTTNNQGMHDRLELPQLQNWDGIKRCDSLLIIAEQGLGDMIQFYRFIIELADAHPEIKIMFFCKQELSDLFNTYNKFEIVKSFTLFSINLYEYKTYLMSLPRLLRVKEILPNSMEYLKINPIKLNEWKNKLNEISTTRPKVGFVYNGLLSSFIEKHIPLEEFIQLCDFEIDLICIHRKKEIKSDIENYDKKYSSEMNKKIHFFDIDKDAPFEDTIHIIKNLDLLITVDTITVHLAGVLNVKTWLLLGHSEWRWSDDPTSTYWYNSVELIRTSGEAFKDIINVKVKDKLAQFTQSHSHVI